MVLTSTRSRFDKETAREQAIMEQVFRFYPWLQTLGTVFEPDNTPHHDYRLTLADGRSATIEIQITNYGRHDGEGFRRYHDVRLDLISAFETSLPECRRLYHIKDGTWKSLKSAAELEKFEKACPVQRWGKLKTCDADFFLFTVVKRRNRCDILHLYDNLALRQRAEYFVERYGVKINQKQDERWGSAFVPVKISDEKLKECLIKNKEEFLHKLSEP
jgi:hypothetical protein